MDLYWLAVSFNVMAHTPPLHHAGLLGRGLSVHAITRSYKAKQSPEPWFAAGSLDGEVFVPHHRPIVLYHVQAEIFAPSHPLHAQQPRSQCVEFLSFVSFTARDGRWSLHRSLQVWVGPWSFEVRRSSGVQKRPFDLISTEPDDFGRDSLCMHHFAFVHLFGRPRAPSAPIITNSAKF